MNKLEKDAIAELQNLANEVKELNPDSPTATLELQKALLRKEIYTHLLHYSTK